MQVQSQLNKNNQLKCHVSVFSGMWRMPHLTECFWSVLQKTYELIKICLNMTGSNFFSNLLITDCYISSLQMEDFFNHILCSCIFPLMVHWRRHIFFMLKYPVVNEGNRSLWQQIVWFYGPMSLKIISNIYQPCITGHNLVFKLLIVGNLYFISFSTNAADASRDFLGIPFLGLHLGVKASRNLEVYNCDLWRIIFG